MKNLISIFIFLPFFTFSQGLLKNDISSSLIKKNNRITKSRSINLPVSHSLEKYTPYVFNQGHSNMCVANSIALARTIIYARNNGLTKKNKISAEAYSPYYIYTTYLNLVGGNFDDGLFMYLNKLNEYGYAKMKEIEYPHYYPFTEKMLWDFKTPTYSNLDIDYIKSEKFDEINCIYIENINDDKEVSETITAIKSELSQNKPIIFGFNIHKSFGYYSDFWTDTIEVLCDGIITNRKGEESYCDYLNTNPSGFCDEHKPESFYEGHAMTLIGYDDSKYGGAFLIQNSWGREKHNNGKFWVPYKVFLKYADGIQSLDKKPKTDFDLVKNYEFNYPNKEIYEYTETFSEYLDPNWILFTALNIENINEKLAKKDGVVLANNLTIKGDLVNNLIEGNAEINLNNLYTYEGSFKNGVFEGNGKLRIYNKWGHVISSSVGNFVNGEFENGNFTKVFSYKNPYWGTPMNGYTYTGNYFNKNINGEGKLVHNQYDWSIKGDFSDGDITFGQIQKTMAFTNDQFIYNGEINRYLLPHGKGVMKINNEIIEGRFTNGSLDE